jgi:glycosyltransferase involved in cell wall biosynthesis
LQNLKLAADKLPKVLFILVGGDGGSLEQIKKLYANNSNVLLTERYISAHDVKDFYQAIDIFLLPSIYEPFGLTIVEAMAQGKLVLASNVGGPSEIIPEGAGELLEPANQELWLQRIKHYQDNPQQIQAVAEQAKAVAAQYQWPNVIQQIIGVYDSL